MQKIFAVYKPKGISSRHTLNLIQQITGQKKVGHAGTLDPLACGVLVVGIGREATKRLKEIVGQEKEYIAVICLGMISDTDDREGSKEAVEVEVIPTKEEVLSALKVFIGHIKQIPPTYSAVKLRGKEAYKLARAGKKFKLKPRTVEVKDIELLDYKWPYVRIKIVSGPGVYIRSIARDLGKVLNTGGYLYFLERTRVGRFSKKEAIGLKDILNSAF